ncbi:MAG TPA: undecaprenyl-diphosphate phosphatase [Solirubrobacteraceae bacterium]|jgi:undecaprenyl-diphosphatase|nr:undecaprenyl-diphosphate phosphatase [Solirubrobacteraceae bacterium]
MPPGSPSLPLRHALALGLAQGPTELLPVSSSAHTTLIPLLLGWPYAELDAELRKSFELALHAGAGVALALDMRRELIDAATRLDRRRAVVIALSLAPAALAGLALRPLIERRLGGPRSIAGGLAAGGLAMGLADVRAGGGGRREDDAGAADGLALGLAQAVALVPGISRYGATLTAARARGFARADAQRLSWHAALPVMLGASALEGARLARRGAPEGALAPLALGAAGALASTSLSARLLRRPARVLRSLLPFALYRLLLAGVLLARPRRLKRAQ